MRRIKTNLILILILVSFASFGQEKENFEFPDYIGYTNDFEGIFTQEQITELDKIISLHEKETSNEITIVTIESIHPYKSLFDYSLDLMNNWGVGKKEKDNGVGIVFGKKIREIQIQVGYGLEADLDDVEAKKIIDNIIIPEFTKGDFFTGIKKGLLEIIKEIE